MDVVVVVVAVGLGRPELLGLRVGDGHRVRSVIDFPGADDDDRRLGIGEADGDALLLESRETDDDDLLLLCRMDAEP